MLKLFKNRKSAEQNDAKIDRIIKDAVDRISIEKNKVEMILQNLTDGVIAFDNEQRVIHMNNAATEMLKISSGKPLIFDEFFENLGFDVRIAEFLYLKRESAIERQVQIDDKIIAAKFVPFKVGTERTAGVVVVLHDITEQFALENSRRELVADVSHELGTPLTTLKTYIETLLDGALDDKETAVEFLKIMENETDRMTRIVKDSLALSRFDSKKIQWSYTYFSLDKLLKSIETKFQIETENKSQTLTYSAITELPQRIYADKDKLEQVITNLVSNSMKYAGDGGKIEIFAGHLYEHEKGRIYIKVRDDGIGIPKKDLPYIFDRFYRVDKARAREPRGGGTGLGLAIAKEIIVKHGGTMEIDSEYGRFTEVIIKLPAI